MTAVYLIGGLILILLAAEFFTNGIEWLGKKMNLSEGAVGSVLAAVGTALPESLIPVIAILSGSGESAEEIGIGAILGAPFMLATLAMALTGVTAMIFKVNGQHRSHMLINTNIMKRDLGFFLVVYTIAILCAFLPNHSLKIAIAILLVLIYVFYVYKTLKAGQRLGEEELNPLYLSKLIKKEGEPSLLIVIIQVLLALIIIVSGAHFFVDGLSELAVILGISPFILSVFIAPIATELPEKFNSVIWIKKGKDTLALGNISGAMVYQGSIIPALGIALTPWNLSQLAVINSALALLATGIIFLTIYFRKIITPKVLSLMALFYLAYVGIVIYL